MVGSSNNRSYEDGEGNGGDENDDNKPAEKEQEAGGGVDSVVDSDTEEIVPLNGRCFKKLVHIVPGQSVNDCIIELKSRNTSCDAFVAIVSNPKKLLEGQFEKLELDGRPF